MRCANVWRSKVLQEEAMPKWHMKAGDGGPVDMNDSASGTGSPLIRGEKKE